MLNGEGTNFLKNNSILREVLKTSDLIQKIDLIKMILT
jgi:hypothetical protein